MMNLNKEVREYHKYEKNISMNKFDDVVNE
jgi:hypothetical protein